MKGSKCRCGFAIDAESVHCPRCGKRMKAAEWKDEGEVMSYTKVGHPPEGGNWPLNIALVQVSDKGPKIICWTDDVLKAGDDVTISESSERQYQCQRSPRA